MFGPEPKLAPVIPPVVAPIVQEKLHGVLDVSAILVPEPLHILTAGELVTMGVGLTVTVIVKGVPTHEPTVAVGVTIYCTVPAVELLGLVSGWLIVGPEPTLAPVILPVITPIVQV